MIFIRATAILLDGRRHRHQEVLFVQGIGPIRPTGLEYGHDHPKPWFQYGYIYCISSDAVLYLDSIYSEITVNSKVNYVYTISLYR